MNTGTLSERRKASVVCTDGFMHLVDLLVTEHMSFLLNMPASLYQKYQLPRFDDATEAVLKEISKMFRVLSIDEEKHGFKTTADFSAWMNENLKRMIDFMHEMTVFDFSVEYADYVQVFENFRHDARDTIYGLAMIMPLYAQMKYPEYNDIYLNRKVKAGEAASDETKSTLIQKYLATKANVIDENEFLDPKKVKMQVKHVELNGSKVDPIDIEDIQFAQS